MAQTIATVSNVFAACDRLDAANERWNREDVRNEVGGGGYVVIDPLIRAWRQLKPLRELAPTTPTELLHQVAESLEAHYAGCIGTMESRLSESRSVFEATVTEFSERVTSLETDLQNREATLETVEEERSDLACQMEECKQALVEKQQANARLVMESDGLRGQLSRMENEHKEETERLRSEAKEQARVNEQERTGLVREHGTELAKQRQELTEAAELAENRLMKILDRERQEARQQADRWAGELTESRDRAQLQREKVIALETSLRQLTDQNRHLSIELTSRVEEHDSLTRSLASERDHLSALQREYESYREEHKIGGQLADLQATIVALQEQIGRE